MSKDNNAFKAGLFMVISAVAILAIIVGIKGLGALVVPKNQYIATFTLRDNVGGLRVGDDVRVGGVKLGSVRDIEFMSDKTNQREPWIRVHFTLPRYVGLTGDARVSVESSVTGTSNLNIDDIKPGRTLLAAGGEIKGSPSGLGALFASLGEIAPQIRDQTVPKVNNAVDKFAALADEVRAKVEPGYQKYDKLATTGDQALGNIRDLFGDTKTDFRQTMASVNSITTKINGRLDAILDKFDGALADGREAMQKVNKTLTDVQAIGENTRDITGNLREVLNSNRSRIEAMIASLKTTGDNLKGASAEIRRSPWRLLYKPGPGDMANLNLFDSAREFAEGANDLNDAATALRDALSNPHADPAHIDSLVKRLDQSFERFNKVESQLWQQVRE